MTSLLDKIQSKIGKDNDDLVLDYTRTHKAISTGSVILDNMLGGGILVKKRISEVFGMEGSGKSTLCLMSIANAIRQNVLVFYFDLEGAFNYDYAKSLGADLETHKDNFAIFQPANLEEVFDIMHLLEKEVPQNREVAFIYDSVAQLKPKALLEKGGTQQQIGLHAQRVGEFTAYLQSQWCIKRHAYILFTNQVRRVPSQGGVFKAQALKSTGIGNGASNDDSFTTTGGNQFRFMCSIRLGLDYAGKIETGSFDEGNLDRTGNYTRCFLVKSRLTKPFQSCKLAIMYGKGFQDSLTIISVLKEYGLISNAGAYYTYIDSDNNPTGEGLSFRVKGKDAFFKELEQAQYQNDMKKSYQQIMETDEKVVIDGYNETEQDDIQSQDNNDMF